MVDEASSRQLIAGALRPAEWHPVEDNPEENLMSFKKFEKSFSKWYRISKFEETEIEAKWDLLTMVGGTDMEDMVEEIAKVKCY